MKKRILKFLIGWYAERGALPGWLSKLVAADRELTEYQHALDQIAVRLNAEVEEWVAQSVTRREPIAQRRQSDPRSVLLAERQFSTSVFRPMLATVAAAVVIAAMVFWPWEKQQPDLGERTPEVSSEQLKTLMAYGGATKKLATRVSYRTGKLAQVWSGGTQRLLDRQRATATDLAGGLVAAKSSLDDLFEAQQSASSSNEEVQ